MENALGMRLIVCCLGVLPLRPFTFFCLLSNVFRDFWSVGRLEIKKKQNMKKKRRLELGGLEPQHNNMRSLEMARRG